MTERRVVKSDVDITMIEVTESDGSKIITRAYAVRGRDPTSPKTFGDMASADTYFEELILQRLKDGPPDAA